MTEDVSKFVTNPRPTKNTNLQNCPKIKKGENLETWLEEMKLWDRAFSRDEHAPQKYLKFREMIKEVDVCPEVQKLVQTKIADNDDFRKKGHSVIERIIKTIRDSLGKTDLEKLSSAWTNFVAIK